MDSGLDETSCYFVDDEGGEVEHGYIFEVEDSFLVYNGGYYPIDAARRKVRISSTSRPSYSACTFFSLGVRTWFIDGAPPGLAQSRGGCVVLAQTRKS